jgi:hypothetical protein
MPEKSFDNFKDFADYYKREVLKEGEARVRQEAEERKYGLPAGQKQPSAGADKGKGEIND